MSFKGRRALMRLVALWLGIAAALGRLPVASPLTADAFNPPLHIAMFEQALGSNFSADARGWVAEGLTRSDVDAAGQGRPEWHFDSANSPAVICNRWRAGPDALLRDAERQAVEAFRIVPTDAPGFDRVGTHRAEALRLYGQYLHAIQDFYTHTNWIELHLDPTTQVTLRSIPPLAPIQQGCDVQALPKELQSGLFAFDPTNLWASITSGAPDFCGPVTAPRPPQDSGFRYCHGPPHPETIEAILSSISAIAVNIINLQAGRDVSLRTLESKFMLSKDLPDLDHGAELLLRSDGTLATYHEEAVRLATEATPETFDVFQQRVVTALGASPELQNRDPDCLFQVLVQGGDPACPRQSTVTPTGELLFRLDGLPADEAAAQRIVDGLRDSLSARPDDEVVVLAYHAEVRLDPNATRVDQGGTGGVLSVAFSAEAVNQTALEDPLRKFSPEETHFTWESTDLFPPTTTSPWFEDGVGFVQFETVQSTRREQGANQEPPVVWTGWGQYSFALDETGSLVLCSATPDRTNREQMRADCLAHPILVLPRVS